MTRRRLQRLAIGVVGACAFLWAHGAPASDSGLRCESAKLKEVWKYGACRLKAQAKAVRRGDSADFAMCDIKYTEKWQDAEAGGGGTCPSTGDQATVQNLITNHTNDISTLLAGGQLQGCTADLAECQAAPQAQRLETGQTACYAASGAVIACAGTGQDGELQMGVARQYLDNGDGTITDTRTGLTWEKKSDDGGTHDRDTKYTWTSAFGFVQSLNAANFAGHSDWRLPNVNEMQSVANYSAANPSVSAVFNSGCVPGCSASVCSCTSSSGYWTSVSLAPYPDCAWIVYFDIGYMSYDFKTVAWYVRAVRGGS